MFSDKGMLDFKEKITSAISLDCEAEADRIATFLKETVGKRLKRHGVVVGVSGGIDSSVTLGLCVRAFGAQRVVGLLMPERDSSEDTLKLSRAVADHFGVRTIHEDITAALEGFRTYDLQEDAVKRVISEFDKGWKFKVVLPSVIEKESLRVFFIVAQSAEGKIVRKRLPKEEYLQIVAATNFKQRTRKCFEYYHADRLHYAVVGTPNRLEFDQGFFVKLGDGSADIKPIAHLYKTQVYSLASYLEVPDEILNRAPTTDTYSMPQEQDEFYFSLTYDKMDICLLGLNNNFPKDEVANTAGLTIEQLERVYKDIIQKRRATQYLHSSSLTIEPILEGQN
ncbi:NAD(+) synthase [Marimonas arenosa]|nr:NAD(+) synthase [Marimonas arenosa]